MKISTKKIEKVFSKSVIPNISCIGIDTASRTGWCRIETSAKWINYDYSFIDMKGDKFTKFRQYIEIFNQMLRVKDITIIEEAFYGRNVKGFQFLSQLGMIVYTIAELKGITRKEFISASEARKFLGFKGNAKKEIIQQQFLKALNLKIDDDDIVDAFILALNGVLKEETLI